MSRSSRSEVDAYLPKPVVESLCDDDPQWDEQGLLPRDKVSEDLAFEVPSWGYEPVPDGITVLELYWDGAEFARKTWDEDVPSLPPGALLSAVPRSRLTSGDHQLHYIVERGDGNRNRSDSQPVTVDLIAPALGADNGQLQFPVTAVTEQYLKANGDKVEAEFLSYLDGKPGDVVTWYWCEDAFDFSNADIVSTRTLSREEIGNPVVLAFDGAMIRARGDGQRYAFYSIADRAGNRSPESRAVRLQVSAQPMPRVLPPAKIKEASGNATTSTLDPARATNGATVVIPPDATINPGEEVYVQWAAPGSVGSYRVLAQTAPGETRIPNTCIAQHFDNSIKVHYEVFESGVVEPHPSLIHTLNVLSMTNYPAPQCDKIANGQLNLADVTDYADFTLASWSFMATDQFINLEVRGVDSSYENLTVTVLSECPVPAIADQISVGRISKADLQRFKLNEGLVVRVAVSFDGKLTWHDFSDLTPVLVDRSS
jgi:hypothetical protein